MRSQLFALSCRRNEPQELVAELKGLDLIITSLRPSATAAHLGSGPTSSANEDLAGRREHFRTTVASIVTLQAELQVRLVMQTCGADLAEVPSAMAIEGQASCCCLHQVPGLTQIRNSDALSPSPSLTWQLVAIVCSDS